MATKIDKLTKEQEAAIPGHVDKWVRYPLRTSPLTKDEKDTAGVSVAALYAAAKEAAPALVYSPDPVTTRIAGGYAAGILYAREKGIKEAFPAGLVPKGEVHEAVAAVVRACIDPATPKAGQGWVEVPAWAPKQYADSDYKEWYLYPVEQACHAAALFGDVEYLAACADKAWGLHNGGNQYPGFAAFVDFFKNVVGLKVDYTNWEHYEFLAKHTGPRITHQKFCIITDMPSAVHVTEDYKPHRVDGPYLAYGNALQMFNVSNIRVPAKYIVRQDLITKEDRDELEQNEELRKALAPVWAATLNDVDLLKTFL